MIHGTAGLPGPTSKVAAGAIIVARGFLLPAMPAFLARFSVLAARSDAVLIALRWGLIVLAAAGLALAQHWLAAPGLPLAPLLLILLALSGWNALAGWRLARRPVSGHALALDALVDIMALTALLFFSGGANNPLTALYLLEIVAAAILLPAALTWLVAAAALAGYTFLLWFFLPLPGLPADPAFVFRLHIFGMWLTFGLSALLIAGLLGRLVATLRRRERELAQVRERQLRDEQLVALGTLAAGAAHELGTPLSTLRLLVDELAAGAPAGTPLSDDCRLMRAQLDACRAALSRLRQSAGVGEGGDTLAAQCRRVLDNWQVARPDVRAVFRVDLGPERAALADPTFAPALLNLLNNAADASPEAVEVGVSEEAGWLRVAIANRGELSPAQLAAIGRPQESAKPGGLGLGVFLAQATLERLGGTVRLDNRDGGGVIATVCLPLDGGGLR